jgi:hypothetical protein
MTTTDWILDLALILAVLRQVRESRLSVRGMALPVVIVGWAVFHYLHSIPTAGHDLELLGALAGIGALLGLLSGAATRVRVHEGHAYIRAGVLAGALWVVGVGFRLAFQLFAEHGGADTIARFSVAHDITSDTAWVAALVLMAVAEVVARLAVITIRGRLGVVRAAHGAADSAGPVPATA